MSATNADSSQRESPLSVAQKWLPWCLALIFGMTAGWTALIAWAEVSGGKHEGVAETAIAVVSDAAPSTPLILIYAIIIVSGLDAVGGLIVVTAKFLEDKFLNPWREKRAAEAREKGRTEGREEGREQERSKWSEWNHRRLEAEANGIPFDEPSPEYRPTTPY